MTGIVAVNNNLLVVLQKYSSSKATPMNLINQSFWIFLSILISLAFVAFRPGLASMAFFIVVSSALLIYQVYITLMDDSDNLEEELASIIEEEN